MLLESSVILDLTPYMLFVAGFLSLITAIGIAWKKWVHPAVRRGRALAELVDAQLQPYEGNGDKDDPPSLITKIDRIGEDTAEVKQTLSVHLSHSRKQDELLEATVGRVEELETV